jgi:hypothetical protein
MTKAEYKYQVGDRVAERPKGHGLFTVNPQVKQRIAKYRSQRYGTLIAIKEKKTSSGARQKILVIQWDNLKSPMEHAQFRICPACEIQKLQSKDYGMDFV